MDDHVDESLLGVAVGLLPELLHPGPLQGLVGELVGEPPERTGGRSREWLEPWRERLLELRLHVDVREQLVDHEVGHGLADVGVLEQLGAGLGPGVVLQRLAVRPDGEDGEEGKNGADRDQCDDRLAPATRLARVDHRTVESAPRAQDPSNFAFWAANSSSVSTPLSLSSPSCFSCSTESAPSAAAGAWGGAA